MAELEAFLQGRAAPAGAERAALVTALERARLEAQTAWPTVSVAPDDFAAYLGARCPTPSAQALAALKAPGLWLACAVVARDRHALEVLQRELVAPLQPALSKMKGPSTLAEEALARLFAWLVVGDGSGPRIADYAGQGDLKRWLKAAATRTALNLLEREKPSDEVRGSELVAPALSPELEAMRTQHREAYAQALATALSGVPAEHRLLLRQYCVDAQTLDALGAQYRVTASAISRRLAKAREALELGLREALASKLTTGEVESLLRVLPSELGPGSALFGKGARGETAS